MLEDIIKAVLESDIKNAGAIILSLILGFAMYWRGAESAKKEVEKPKSEIQRLLEHLREEEGIDQLTLQQLQAVADTVHSLEKQQEELAAAVAVSMELMKSFAVKIDSIHTTVEVLKELFRGK